jgi:RNA polymerase sigma-70 factor (ECF subfamily)
MFPDPLEADDLVEAARNGEGTALDRLFAFQLPMLHRFVRFRAGSVLRAHESCADVVQSVCREVLGDLPRFTFVGLPEFRAWIFAQAEHKLADRARYWQAQKRDDRRIERADDWASGDWASGTGIEEIALVEPPSGFAVARETAERLDVAYRALPENYRQVIALSRGAGLSHREIAAQLKKSEVAVRSLLSRALAELVEGIAERDPPPG